MSETPEIIYCGRFGKLIAISDVAPMRYIARLVVDNHTYLFSVASVVAKDAAVLTPLMKQAMAWDRAKDDVRNAELCYGIR